MRIIKRFLNNLLRVVKWLPIIWKTREYDFDYTLMVLLYQMERQLKFFKGELFDKPVTLNTDDEINSLEECIYFLNKIINEIEYDDVNGDYLKQNEEIFFEIFKNNYRKWWD